MKLSIIICTYNREKYIYNVLKSIAVNNYSKDSYEIVLINNNSTDNTELECQRFCNDFQEVEFLYFIEKNQGLSYARNRGIKESKGDILIYVDDDATVNDGYLRAYADFFESHLEADAAGGPIFPVYETKEPVWMSYYTRMLITAYKYEGDKIKPFSKGKFPSGGNAAYRKVVFDKIGLFNVELGRKGESLIGAEEKDLFDKMKACGMLFFYIPNAILYHIIQEKKLTQTYFNQLTFSIGKSERLRTLTISKNKYIKRLIEEFIKWGVSLILWLFYVVTFSPQKGWKLIQFRWNVTKGLI